MLRSPSAERAKGPTTPGHLDGRTVDTPARKVISERLRHSSMVFTLQVYAHVIPAMTSKPPTAWPTCSFALATGIAPSADPKS